jgi:hypothetical protein
MHWEFCNRVGNEIKHAWLYFVNGEGVSSDLDKADEKSQLTSPRGLLKA